MLEPHKTPHHWLLRLACCIFSSLVCLSKLILTFMFYSLLYRSFWRRLLWRQAKKKF